MTTKKMDLVVSFDTTGSMFPVLSQVRREVESFVNNMFSEFSDLRIGIIAHGDYCDADDPYTIIYRELSRDAVGLCKFVRDVDKTFGGDADECYELVLNLAHSNKMGWREDAVKILVMIGDASPHSPRYPDNKDHLDWVEETDELRKMGVKIMAVHALAGMRSSSRGFYKHIAEKTLGVYLTLDQFSDIVDLINATVYQQSGEEKLNEFITIIKDSGKLTRSMSNNFKRLKGESVPDDDRDYTYVRHSRGVTRTHSKDCEVTLKEMGGLVPVVPGRFQVMTVDENCDIRGFVEKNGIEFKKGRGFYELTKAETVQQYKEVIMQDRETGEMFNGSQVREKLKLSPQSEKGGVNEKLHAADAKEFRIFVQSTSVNRKLIAGTTFLYEIPDMEDTGTVVECDVDKSVEETPVEKPAETPVEKPAETPVEKPKARKKKAKKEESVSESVDTPKVTESSKETVAEASEKPSDEPVVETDTPEKTYAESIDFSDFGEATEVISASSKEIDEMLMGKENKLTEKLTDHAKTIEETESAKPVDKEELAESKVDEPKAESEAVKEEEHKVEKEESKVMEEEPKITKETHKTKKEKSKVDDGADTKDEEEIDAYNLLNGWSYEKMWQFENEHDGKFKTPSVDVSDVFYKMWGVEKNRKDIEKTFMPMFVNPVALALPLIGLKSTRLNLNDQKTRSRFIQAGIHLRIALDNYLSLVGLGKLDDFGKDADTAVKDAVNKVLDAVYEFNMILERVVGVVFGETDKDEDK